MKSLKLGIEILIIFATIFLYNIIDRILRYLFFGISTQAPKKLAEMLGFEAIRNSDLYANSVLFEMMKGNFLTWLSIILFVSCFYFIHNRQHELIDSKCFSIVARVSVILLTIYYAYNLINVHFGSGGFIDSIILLMLGYLAIRKWHYLLLWTPFLYACMGEFNYPLTGFSFTDKQMPLLVINLFLSSELIKFFVTMYGGEVPNIVREKFREIEGILITVGLASCYFVPFLSKLVLGPKLLSWPFVEDFSMSFAHYSLRGWISNDYWSKLISEYLDIYGVYLLFIALIIEGLVVFLFVGKKVRGILFYLPILLHLSIFFLSGIFFWKWIVVDVAFIISVKQRPVYLTKRMQMYSLILLFASFWVLNISHLAWYTTPYYSQYRIQVQTETGYRKNVVLHEMHPYNLTFSFARFNLIENDRRPPAYVAGYQDLLSIEEFDSNEIHADGLNRNTNIENFRIFLKDYFATVNANVDNGFYKNRFEIFPQHVYYFPANPHYSWDEKVSKIYVLKEVCDLYESREVVSEIVMEIEL